MQMTHPDSGTYNIKYINYTDRETKRQRGDAEIFPKDSLSPPEGRAMTGGEEWMKERTGERKLVQEMDRGGEVGEIREEEMIHIKLK